jgi:uncharacterized membrane protein
MVVGLSGSAVTIIVSAANAVSAQQAIAMALPAGLITLGGLTVAIMPDAWTAWRRGFRHGCAAALNCPVHGLDAHRAAKSASGQRQHARLA